MKILFRWLILLVAGYALAGAVDAGIRSLLTVPAVRHGRFHFEPRLDLEHPVSRAIDVHADANSSRRNLFVPYDGLSDGVLQFDGGGLLWSHGGIVAPSGLRLSDYRSESCPAVPVAGHQECDAPASVFFQRVEVWRFDARGSWGPSLRGVLEGEHTFELGHAHNSTAVSNLREMRETLSQPKRKLG